MGRPWALRWRTWAPFAVVNCYLVGEQQLQVLTRLCVANLDLQVLLLEEAFLLRHVSADEGQVRLRLEAGHEGELLDLSPRLRADRPRRCCHCRPEAALEVEGRSGNSRLADLYPFDRASVNASRQGRCCGLYSANSRLVKRRENLALRPASIRARRARAARSHVVSRNRPTPMIASVKTPAKAVAMSRLLLAM